MYMFKMFSNSDNKFGLSDFIIFSLIKSTIFVVELSDSISISLSFEYVTDLKLYFDSSTSIFIFLSKTNDLSIIILILL